MAKKGKGPKGKGPKKRAKEEAKAAKRAAKEAAKEAAAKEAPFTPVFTSVPCDIKGEPDFKGYASLVEGALAGRGCEGRTCVFDAETYDEVRKRAVMMITPSCGDEAVRHAITDAFMEYNSAVHMMSDPATTERMARLLHAGGGDVKKVFDHLFQQVSAGEHDGGMSGPQYETLLKTVQADRAYASRGKVSGCCRVCMKECGGVVHIKWGAAEVFKTKQQLDDFNAAHTAKFDEDPPSYIRLCEACFPGCVRQLRRGLLLPEKDQRAAGATSMARGGSPSHTRATQED